MKKVLLIWLLAAGFASAGATAQNIALGERVPELKIQTWLDNLQINEKLIEQSTR